MMFIRKMYWSVVIGLCLVVLVTILAGCDLLGMALPGPTMTISPGKGPSGTEATITITGALPNAPVTLDLDPGSTTGVTDATGSLTYTHRFFGQVGDVSNVSATIGAANEQSASATFEVTGEGGLDASNQTGLLGSEGPQLTVEPSRGPSGTQATITISGALPNAPVTLDLDPGSTSGMTDADGNWSYSHTFFGQVGDIANIKATIGAANEQTASGTFEVTGDAGEAMLQAGEGGLMVSVNPGKGPSGTQATITVSGAEPNQPVTLQIGEALTSGRTDANGNFTYEFTFYGQVGDVIPIEATVGTSSDSPKASTSFEITAPLEQSFNATTTIGTDEGRHGSFINMLEQLVLVVRSGSVIIEGPAPWVQVRGELDGEGNLTANGAGTVAGFPGIAVTFEGTVSMQHIEGEYTMGAKGGLPGGLAIVYLIEGSAEESETLTSEIPEADRVVDFFVAFNAAQAVEDAQALHGMLHPAVLALYGTQACETYLESIVNPDVLIEVLQVTGYGMWNWAIDGRTTPIEATYAADVRVTAADQVVVQGVHLAVGPDGRLGWFTDCGDPLE